MTGDATLDGLYAELDRIETRRRELYALLAQPETGSLRREFAALEAEKSRVWDRIRFCKADRSAAARGEDVRQPSERIGGRRSRWEE